MKKMQVFDIQNCNDRDLVSWAISFLPTTSSYSYGNRSYHKFYVSQDPDDEDCLFHARRYYKTSPTDAANLLKLKAWMESDGLEYAPYPENEVLIKIWW